MNSARIVERACWIKRSSVAGEEGDVGECDWDTAAEEVDTVGEATSALGRARGGPEDGRGGKALIGGGVGPAWGRGAGATTSLQG